MLPIFSLPAVNAVQALVVAEVTEKGGCPAFGVEEVTIGTGCGGLEDFQPSFFCFGKDVFIAVPVGIDEADRRCKLSR